MTPVVTGWAVFAVALALAVWAWLGPRRIATTAQRGSRWAVQHARRLTGRPGGAR